MILSWIEQQSLCMMQVFAERSLLNPLLCNEENVEFLYLNRLKSTRHTYLWELRKSDPTNEPGGEVIFPDTSASMFGFFLMSGVLTYFDATTLFVEMEILRQPPLVRLS